MFERIDCILIDKVFQPISNKFQRLTGRTCFFLAKTFFSLSCGSVIAMVIFHSNLIITSYFPLFLIMVLLAGILLILLNRKIKKIPSDMDFFLSGQANLYRIDPAAFMARCANTLVMIFFIALDIYLYRKMIRVNIYFDVYLVVLWIAHYLLACTPLPPQKSWVRKLLEKFKLAEKGITSPVAVPAKAWAIKSITF